MKNIYLLIYFHKLPGLAQTDYYTNIKKAVDRISRNSIIKPKLKPDFDTVQTAIKANGIWENEVYCIKQEHVY